MCIDNLNNYHFMLITGILLELYGIAARRCAARFGARWMSVYSLALRVVQKMMPSMGMMDCAFRVREMRTGCVRNGAATYICI